MLDRRLFVSGVDDLMKAHGSRLRDLCGKTITATWVAWDSENDTWFPGEAVILGVGSDNLEIVCWKLNEIALTWNAIDVLARPAWVDSWPEDMALTWRKDALPALARMIGRTITGVSIVEYLFRTRVIADRHCTENIGQENQAWLLHGVEFSFGQDQLRVFNALDENGVTIDPPFGSDYRRTEVASSTR